MQHSRQQEQLRKEKIWSPLDISGIVYGTLKEHNPNARCLYWKLTVFTNNDDANDLAAWIRAKLSIGETIETTKGVEILALYTKELKHQKVPLRVCVKNVYSLNLVSVGVSSN
jgi:hypothetical protein